MKEIEGKPASATAGEGVVVGDFTERHVGNRSRLIAWSHRSRFEVARRLLEPYRGAPLLDYGSGDGTFLSLVRDLFPDRLGADIWDEQLEMCRRKFAADPGLTFIRPEEIPPPKEGSFGVVTCMEVLEHCPPDEFQKVVADLRRLVHPDGVVLISVPIEVGPTLALKQSARWLASRRGIGPYAHPNERYRPTELLRMIVATDQTSIDRPIYDYGQHGHKGFNWRRLRRELRASFRIERQTFSPLPLLAGLVNSQVWFVCKALR